MDGGIRIYLSRRVTLEQQRACRGMLSTAGERKRPLQANTVNVISSVSCPFKKLWFTFNIQTSFIRVFLHGYFDMFNTGSHFKKSIEVVDSNTNFSRL